MLGEDEDDLSLRECIHGKMKLMDHKNEKKIHSSDFQAAVEQLGLKYSDPAVSQVLIRCKVDMEGFIDYKPLESELEAERYYASKKADSNKQKRQLWNHSKSSSGVMNDGMFDGGELHDQRAQCEKNRRVIQRHRDDVRNAWSKFTHSEMSKDKFIQFVEYLDMAPTKAFRDALRKQDVDVPLAEVFTSLSQVDPNLFSRDYGDNLLTKAQQEDKNSVGRRHFYDKTDYTLNPFSDSRTEKRAMKYDRSEHGNRTLNSSQVGDSLKASSHAGGRAQAQFMTQNRAVENALALAQSSPRPISGMPAVGSSRVRGDAGRLVAGHTSLANAESLGEDVCYSSEIRILREQTLVALRQVDEGSMSGVEFVDRLYQLGLILPEGMINMVQRRGDIDYKGCVKALDAEVFMKRAIHGRSTPSEVAVARGKLLACLHKRGSADSVVGLGRAFRIMDDNNDKRLSFGEFRKGCRDFGVEEGEGGTTDDDLRLLFNSFDKDGNGFLSYDELLVAIRGELSPLRSAWVKSAFQKLDRTGDGIATVEDLVGVYDTTGHPDVLSGKKTSIDVLRSILDQMDTKGEEDGLVTESEFLSYYGGISASIDSDAHFVEMVKKSWRITELKPPARTVRKSAQDRKVVHVNLADQTHGDVINWTNDSSNLEEEGARRSNKAGTTNSRFHNKGLRGGVNGLGHHDSTLKLFTMDSKFDGDAHREGIPNDEWLAAGAVRLKRHPNHKAISSTGNDILSWPGASGAKENKAEVAAKMEAARLDEESRLFPKGPRLNSGVDAPLKEGSTCFSGALGQARALLGDNGPVTAGRKSNGDAFEAQAGEIYFGPRVTTNTLRSRDYNQSCPFGYDEPSKQTAAKTATTPASAGGPTIGADQKRVMNARLDHGFSDPSFQTRSPTAKAKADAAVKGRTAFAASAAVPVKHQAKSLADIMAATKVQ